MNIFLVTWESQISEHTPLSEGIISVIQSYENHKFLNSSAYAIKTTDSPDMIANKMRPYIREKSAIFILAICKPFDGHGPSWFGKWLDENLSG